MVPTARYPPRVASSHRPRLAGAGAPTACSTAKPKASSRTVEHRPAVDDHLHPDRMPDGLQLEERGDVVRALRIGAAANDPLDVLRAELFQVRGVAVGPREIERGDVHVRR